MSLRGGTERRNQIFAGESRREGGVSGGRQSGGRMPQKTTRRQFIPVTDVGSATELRWAMEIEISSAGGTGDAAPDMHCAGCCDRVSKDVLVLTGKVPLRLQEFVRTEAIALSSRNWQEFVAQ